MPAPSLEDVFALVADWDYIVGPVNHEACTRSYLRDIPVESIKFVEGRIELKPKHKHASPVPLDHAEFELAADGSIRVIQPPAPGTLLFTLLPLSPNDALRDHIASLLGQHSVSASTVEIADTITEAAAS